MKISNWRKRFAAIAGSALMGLTLTIGANAANPEQVPVEVTFIAPIAIGEDNPLQFGLLDIAMADTSTVTINTDDSYSESTANTVVGGTQLAADLTITVADATPMTILVNNVGVGTYYTLGAWMCSYQSGTDTACDGTGYDLSSSGASGNVEIGATLTVVGTPIASVDNVTFDVTVTYQ